MYGSLLTGGFTMNLTKQGMKNLKRMMKEPATKRQIKSFNESIGYMEKVNSVKCMCHCHTEMHPVGRMYGCPEMNCIHCQPQTDKTTGCGIKHVHNYYDCCAACSHGEIPSEGASGHVKTCKRYKPKDKTTWETKFNKYYGLMFECGDYEQLIKDIANELRKEYARGQLDEITAIRQLDNKTRDNDSHTYDIYTQSDMDFAQAQALDIYRGKLWELIKDRHETCDDCSLRAELENLLTLEK